MVPEEEDVPEGSAAEVGGGAPSSGGGDTSLEGSATPELASGVVPTAPPVEETSAKAQGEKEEPSSGTDQLPASTERVVSGVGEVRGDGGSESETTPLLDEEGATIPEPPQPVSLGRHIPARSPSQKARDREARRRRE